MSYVALLYGILTTALVVLGWRLGDATWWLYLANLTTFYWLAPAVLLVPLAVGKRWWLPAASCLVAAVVWIATFAPLFLPQRPGPSPTLRVASYNISPEPDVSHVARLVERARPDVLLVQEVLREAQPDLVRAVPALPFHHFSPVNTRAAGGGGTAVLSRFPLIDARPVRGLPAGSRPTDIVTVDTDDGPVDVVSLHLTSPCRDCATGQSPTQQVDSEAWQRTAESDRVVAALVPGHAVIVGGDLNSDTLNAPRRHLVNAGLADVHRAAGSGPGFTRLRSHGLVRIDWLLASPSLRPVREWVERRDGSDHRPVVADLALVRAAAHAP